MDFDSRLAKIEQQAQAKATRLEVVDALRSVHTILRFHCLQFNDDHTFDQHISRVFPDDDIVVPDRDSVLLCHAETRLMELVSQGCNGIRAVHKPVSGQFRIAIDDADQGNDDAATKRLW